MDVGNFELQTGRQTEFLHSCLMVVVVFGRGGFLFTVFFADLKRNNIYKCSVYYSLIHLVLCFLANSSERYYVFLWGVCAGGLMNLGQRSRTQIRWLVFVSLCRFFWRYHPILRERGQICGVIRGRCNFMFVLGHWFRVFSWIVWKVYVCIYLCVYVFVCVIGSGGEGARIVLTPKLQKATIQSC